MVWQGNARHNEALSTGRRSVGGVDVSPKSAGGRSSRRHTPAPPSYDGDRFERPLEALPEGDGSSGSEYEPDLFNVALRVRSLGPISIAGGARVKASLYKGYVPDDDDDARGETRVASGEMASASSVPRPRGGMRAGMASAGGWSLLGRTLAKGLL